MPEFHFAISNHEIEDTLDHIIELGGYVQKNKFITELDRYIFTKEDLKKYYDSELTSKIYIYQKESYICPMPTFSVVRNGVKKFGVYDRIGGPTIIFIYLKTVSKGFCFYYPTYYFDDVNYEKFKPNQALIDFYKALFKFVRKKCIVIKYNGKIYCGREYLRQVMEGTAEFEIEDEFKTAILEQMNDKTI